jgi:hypothetical protein
MTTPSAGNARAAANELAPVKTPTSITFFAPNILIRAAFCDQKKKVLLVWLNICHIGNEHRESFIEQNDEKRQKKLRI